MNINRVTLLGYLTQDVKLTRTKTDKTFSTFTVATNYLSTPEYHSCIAWGKLSDVASTYMKKGDRLYLEGRLATKQWEGKDKKKHEKTEVVATHLIMLGKSDGAAQIKQDEVGARDHGDGPA